MTSILKRSWLVISLAVLTSLLAISPALASEDTESEAVSSIEISGQLIELSSTDVPTTIIVRENPEGTWVDYTVDINEDTKFKKTDDDESAMEDWITGDWLTVKGELNENTGVVTAQRVVNHSMSPRNYHGLNGWITAIDEENSTMTVQWNNIEHVVNVTDNTHMVVPPVNPASLGDFEINDRVRIRLIKDSEIENEARIIIALRRGEEIFLKARTRGFWAELNEIDDNGDGTGALAVTLLNNPHLRPDDVNNLVGDEGDEEIVYYDLHTKFVRKYHGRTDIDELQEGDRLFIVGRVDDDNSITARLVKDSSIWQKNVAHHLGEITQIDTDGNEIIVSLLKSGREWTVLYDDETVIKKDGEEVDDTDLEVGDVIRVRGTARATDKTVDADTITVRKLYHILTKKRAEIREYNLQKLLEEAENEE